MSSMAKEECIESITCASRAAKASHDASAKIDLVGRSATPLAGVACVREGFRSSWRLIFSSVAKENVGGAKLTLLQKQCCFNCSDWWGVDWLLAWLNGDNPHSQILCV